MSASSNKNITGLLKMIQQMTKPKFTTVGTWVLVTGLPNVGKSSLINALRAKSKEFENSQTYTESPAKVGPMPCVTRGVSGFKVSLDPLMFVIDTPGVMWPRIDDAEVGMKMALVGTIKDEIVGRETLADYLLYTLNQSRAYAYVDKYGLKAPTDNLQELLSQMSRKFNWDDGALCDVFLKHFRLGKLGRLTLDQLD
jgi:ribosome biogenesis GTPase A